MPSSINLSTPLKGHHPIFTSLLDWTKVISWPMKDGNGERTFEMGLIITISCHPWYSKVKVRPYFSSLTHFFSHNHTNYFSLPIEHNPSNPLQQVTPVPPMPCKQHPRKPTPGPSGTQWSEDLFCEPSQHDEPPIPGLSQSSKSQLPSHEDASTHEPEPEVALMQFTEEPFACPTTPHYVIIIDNKPVSSPLQLPLPLVPWRSQLPPPPIPTMRLGRKLLTFNQT
ncbi:hypothetical protein O181_052145 [Austropuccinia psidii MF-1]|uniref:Uncharacterized protein n=1 Tax=Austropuccinia psidii MF-1 TaxID=1389203 RepID=A0A9Q3DYC7_9BASI|nr:hypothetical protein [Austropuccinia psidii MF-1]